MKMTKLRTEQAQLLSETTRLLIDEAPQNGSRNRNRSNSDGSSSSPNPSNGSLELGNFSFNDEQSIDDNDLGPFPGSPQTSGKYSPRRKSYKIALMGILAIAVVAFRFLGSVEEAGKNGKNDITKVSLIGTSQWDDETHHEWETFVANEKGNSRFEFQADPGAVVGGLLGTKKATKTQTQQTDAGASTAETTITLAVNKEEAAENSQLLYFNQTSAFSRLNPLESDFFHYQQGWEAQITQALCAIATSAALLNSLRYAEPNFKLPQDSVYVPFPWATQKELLASAQTNDCVREALGGRLANADAVFHMGLGLTMVPRLLNCFLEDNEYLATRHPAVAADQEEATKEIVLKALRDPSSRVVYNYDRGGIGQGPLGHGHWSPLGGYHEPTDSILVMDVAKYKHPMVWVPWKDLWSGALTVDGCGETLSLKKLNWSVGFPQLKDYLASRCIPGQRGFVVVEPFPRLSVSTHFDGNQ